MAKKDALKGEWCEMPCVMEINGVRIDTTAHFWLSGAKLRQYKEKRARQWLQSLEEWDCEHVSYVTRR